MSKAKKFVAASNRACLINIYKTLFKNIESPSDLTNVQISTIILEYIAQHIDPTNQDTVAIHYVISVQLEELYEQYLGPYNSDLTLDELLSNLVGELSLLHQQLVDGEIESGYGIQEVDALITYLYSLASNFDLVIDFSDTSEDISDAMSEDLIVERTYSESDSQDTDDDAETSSNSEEECFTEDPLQEVVITVEAACCNGCPPRMILQHHNKHCHSSASILSSRTLHVIPDAPCHPGRSMSSRT